MHNGYGGGLFSGDDNVLELDSVVVTQHHECTECHQIVHFKIVNFYVM